MAPELTVDSSSIVIIGEFMPAVFQPAWLANKNLLAPKEAESAKVEVVHPDATVFQTDWLALNVRRNRLTATCIRGESTPLLRDLVIGIIQLFSNSPLTAVGLNKELHFKMESETAWHELGHKLAPKELWKSALLGPGLLSLQMQGERPDDRKGSVNVVVQPSGKIKFGTFVQVNDHYDMRIDGKEAIASDAMGLIKNCWEQSLERSTAIAREIVNK